MSTAGQSCPIWQTEIISGNLKWALRNPARCLLIRTHVTWSSRQRCATQAPILRAKRGRRLRKLMQQRHIPNRFRHPRQRATALIRRQQPDVQLFKADPAVGGGPAHVDGARASSGNPNATPCAAAITGRGMSAGAGTAVCKSWRCVRVGGALRPESECCGGACRSDGAVVVSFNLFFTVGRKEKGNFRGDVAAAETGEAAIKNCAAASTLCGGPGRRTSSANISRAEKEGRKKLRTRTCAPLLWVLGMAQARAISLSTRP